MAIPILDYLSNLWKSPPKRAQGPTYAILAGINQTVFLKQWGMPEFRLSFVDLQKYFFVDLLPLNHDPLNKESMTIWIYKKMDRIIFFKGEKLISHFKWSHFKERFKKGEEKMEPRDNPKSARSEGNGFIN